VNHGKVGKNLFLFFQSHIPDNLEVDTSAMEMLTSVERMRGKALGSARMLAEHFGWLSLLVHSALKF